MFKIYYIQFPNGMFEARNGSPHKEAYFYSEKQFKLHVAVKALACVGRVNKWQRPYKITPKDIPELREKYKDAIIHTIERFSTGAWGVDKFDALTWIEDYYHNGYSGQK